MSNTAVGGVYNSIIEEVLSSSRVDFEEMGIEAEVLDELRKGWQKKLSQSNVAQFPWDPKPEPVPTPNPATTQAALGAPPSAIPNYTQAQLSPPPNSPSLSLPNLPLPQVKADPGAVKTEPLIKQEPGLQQQPSMPPNFANAPVGNAAIAQARAMQQLQSTYGQRAAASITAMQNGLTQPQQQGGNPGQSQTMPRPGGQAQQQQPGNMNSQQYRAQLAAATAAQQRQATQQNANGANGAHGLPQSQVDGASDPFEGVLMRQDVDGNPVELGRFEIDSMLHEQIAAKAKRMEGGGLMLPLKQATQHGSKVSKRGDASTSQLDGVDGDEEEDEDAINSDLDDDDVGQEEDEDDDEAGQIMLCMYDKVQRVKNKWKCTLKDGVLTVNGKEYVFHKATGEYEW